MGIVDAGEIIKELGPDEIHPSAVSAGYVEFARQWGVGGMPADKIRLAKAAYNAAIEHAAGIAINGRDGYCNVDCCGNRIGRKIQKELVTT